MPRLSRLLNFLSNYSPSIAKEDIKISREKWRHVIEKLTDEQLHTGCEYVKNHDAQFIIPARFIFVAHGLIDAELAYEQAKDGIYNHPAVYNAAKRSNLNKSAVSLDQEFNNFKRAYNFECDKVLRGEKLQSIPASTNINNIKENISYQRYKSMIAAQYGKDVANKHCVHEGWSQKQCMDFIRDKLGNNHKLVKTLEQNL